MDTGQVISTPRVHPLRTRVEALLAEAGVQLDGPRPWDLQVRRPRLFARVLAQGSLGLGEAYMDGDWDSDSLDGLITRLLQARLDRRVGGLAAAFDGRRARLQNLQTRRRSREGGRRQAAEGGTTEPESEMSHRSV